MGMKRLPAYLLRACACSYCSQCKRSLCTPPIALTACAPLPPPPAPPNRVPLRLALLQVCDMALQYLDVCLPEQGPLAAATPVPASSRSPAVQSPPSAPATAASATASPLTCPPASSSTTTGSCAIEPLAALADPEAQAAFMQRRLAMATHAFDIAAAVLSRWGPQRALSWRQAQSACPGGPMAELLLRAHQNWRVT